MLGSVDLDSIRSRQGNSELSKKPQRRSRKEPESGKARVAPAGKSSVAVKGSQEMMAHEPKGLSPSPMNGMHTRLRSAKGVKYV